MSKFKEIYLSEADDHIQKLNENLLFLEKATNNKVLLDELMRSSHTLKGSSAAMGYAKTAFLTHVMEDVFDFARNGELEITSKIITTLFKTVDALEKSIESIRVNNTESDVEVYAEALKKITGVSTEGIGKSLRDASGKPIIKKNSSSKKIEKQGQQIDADTASDVIPDEDFSVSRAVTKIDHIKVPVERLDKLMSLLEELIIDKMKFVELAKKMPEIESLTDHLDRLVMDLQFQVMQARLVPVEQIFARFPRLVRDIASQMNKEIDFQIIGGDIELDRAIVDKLAEPLVHLLKNAMDHGIEQKGILILKATREKEFALISVENDGKSIDWDKVRASSISRGIISKEEADHLDENGLMNLLYKGHLSTKEEVTETSGRGIGMSAVKQFVEKNRGRIMVESPLNGGGTRFTLELPVSIAIINSLLVEVNKKLFAIPFSVIDRSVRVQAENIKSMADQDVAVIDEQNVPLVYLSKMFNDVEEVLIDDKKEVVDESIKKSVLAVLLKRGSESVGLVVDALSDELEIIVKPLPIILREVKGFSGSTILGDGRTILIVDAMSLLEDTSRLIRTESQ